MITTPTVFILGAGASIPYEFPSGQALADSICEPGENVGWLVAYGFEESHAKRFVKELRRAQSESIDSFLEDRPEFKEIGKTAIAIRLIKYENQEQFFIVNKRNWYTLLLKRMYSSLDEFPNNTVSIVTFNYDRSLEHFIFEALCARSGKPPSEVAAALQKIPFIHVHGQMGFLPWQTSSDNDKRPYATTESEVAVRTAAKGIKIVSEGNEESEEFVAARRSINDARRLHFLGFGYHETNMRRLGASFELFDKKEVSGTCFGMTDAEQDLVLRRVNYSLKHFGPANQGNHEFLRNSKLFLSD